MRDLDADCFRHSAVILTGSVILGRCFPAAVPFVELLARLFQAAHGGPHPGLEIGQFAQWSSRAQLGLQQLPDPLVLRLGGRIVRSQSIPAVFTHVPPLAMTRSVISFAAKRLSNVYGQTFRARLENG